MSNCPPRYKKYNGTTKMWVSEASIFKDEWNILQHHRELVEIASFEATVQNAPPDSTSQICHTTSTDQCD